jgi:hypothetical protein
MKKKIIFYYLTYVFFSFQSKKNDWSPVSETQAPHSSEIVITFQNMAPDSLQSPQNLTTDQLQIPHNQIRLSEPQSIFSQNHNQQVQNHNQTLQNKSQNEVYRSPDFQTTTKYAESLNLKTSNPLISSLNLGQIVNATTNVQSNTQLRTENSIPYPASQKMRATTTFTTRTTTTTSTTSKPSLNQAKTIKQSTKIAETKTVQKLNGAYIFPRPTLKTIESGPTNSPTPSSKLEQPYKLTLQSGDRDLPLVGFFQTPLSGPTESTLLEIESGDFGAKIVSENDGDKKVEFRPVKNVPVRIAKGAMRKKSSKTTEVTTTTTEANIFFK